MSLALLLALPFIGSVVAASLPANARNTAATWAAAVSLACAAWLASMFPAVRDGLSVKGTLYALPFYAESSMTYYRTDLF